MLGTSNRHLRSQVCSHNIAVSCVLRFEILINCHVQRINQIRNLLHASPPPFASRRGVSLSSFRWPIWLTSWSHRGSRRLCSMNWYFVAFEDVRWIARKMQCLFVFFIYLFFTLNKHQFLFFFNTILKLINIILTIQKRTIKNASLLSKWLAKAKQKQTIECHQYTFICDASQLREAVQR